MDLLNSSLIFFAILLVASLSGLVSERAGIVNIAINGLMICGAMVFAMFSNILKGREHEYTWLFAMLFAAGITGVFALLHGFATIKLKADHVISGTAINLLAAGIATYVTIATATKFRYQDVNSFQAVYLPRDMGAFTDYNVFFVIIALSVTSTIFVYFKYTKFGLRHISVGENPNASDSAAINVNKYKWIAVYASGFLAGMAGSMMVFKMGVFSGNVQGIGFLGLAIMILGQWRIPLIIVSAFGFSILYAIADKYVIESIPKDIMKMAPFVLSLVALVFMSKFQSAPKAAGQHFDKAKR